MQKPALPSHLHHRSDLQRIAVRAMREKNLLPEFSDAALQQLAAMVPTPVQAGGDIRDLGSLLWCSIDNDDSLDLDQLTYCEPLDHGGTRMLVAIADVDALVPQGSALDAHAHCNTVSVYTSARVFPMLPARLSNDLTSLNQDAARLAVVTEMCFSQDAVLTGSTVYRARVVNQAKLAYDAVSDWLEGKGALPAAVARVPGMDQQLLRQDALAQKLRVLRKTLGSLEFETFQPHALFDGENIVGIDQQVQNRGRQLIEEVMVAANGCNARFLLSHDAPSLRRVVRSPDRWARIVEVAHAYQEDLPPQPDSRALEAFLARRHLADPLRFADLSLVIIKLMGSGEYVVETPGQNPIGHFGLALRQYTHSTAPNRRYPDLVTSRVIKALLAGRPAPYTPDELLQLARHCTSQEDAARKVERRMRKSEAALLLESRIGDMFAAVVTGAEPDGTWVRLLTPPAEGRLVHAARGTRVGDKLQVRLISTDVERGFLDFAGA